MTPEGKVVAYFRKKIDAAYGEEVWRFAPVQMGYGVHGVPDELICIRGKFFAVELKAPGGKATGLQMEQIRRIRRAGGWAVVCIGKDGVDRVVEQIIAMVELLEDEL